MIYKCHINDYKLSNIIMFMEQERQLINYGFNQGILQDYIRDEQLVKVLKQKGIKRLFAVQYETFPLIYSGCDLIARDRTGSGKTLAFTLPVLQKFRIKNAFYGDQSGKVKFLIILPTRELAKQVRTQIQSLKVTKNKYASLAIYGGVDIYQQIRFLKSGIDIIVATPGRLLDLLDKRAINFKFLKVVCLDEADEMLRLGFQEDVQKIFQHITSHTTSKPQTLFFSATIPDWVHNLSDKYQDKDVKFIDLVRSSAVNNATSTTVRHYKAEYRDWRKPEEIINRLISQFGIEDSDEGNKSRILIFTETKIAATKIGQNFRLGMKVGVLHGDIPQYKREQIFTSFKNGNLKCLIATNVAARGLDFPEISLVVQLEPPRDTETYIHRSGRTGRAGKTGTCITLYTSDQFYLIRKIEKQASISIVTAPEYLQKNQIIDVKINQPIHKYSSQYKIYLSNLPSTINKKQIQELFRSHEVAIQIQLNKNSQNLFVAFGCCEDEESLWKALSLDGYRYGAKSIKIQWWIED